MTARVFKDDGRRELLGEHPRVRRRHDPIGRAHDVQGRQLIPGSSSEKRFMLRCAAAEPAYRDREVERQRGALGRPTVRCTHPGQQPDQSGTLAEPENTVETRFIGEYLGQPALGPPPAAEFFAIGRKIAVPPAQGPGKVW